MSGRPGTRTAGVLIAGTLAAGALGACNSVRTSLGPTSSNCYLILPTAVQAIHNQGHLSGMRLIDSSALTPSAPDLAHAAGTSSAGTQVCLVAFGGHFSQGDVERPVGRTEGKVAVVETTYPGGRVLATWLGPRPPVRVGHTHLGVP